MAGLQAYLAFTETVKHGNFAGAAREMGLSASAVAKSVSRLETDLGVRLFHRTTRQVTLTSDGQELHERCKHITDEIEALRNDAAGARSEPSGTLRISVPVVIGRQIAVPALAELARRYPRLAMDVAYSDRYADLIKEGLDAVIRVGHLPNSTLVGRKISEQQLVVCASPAYLKRRGTPRKPADMADHECILFRVPTTGLTRPWHFQEGGKPVELKPTSRIVMNDGDGLVAAAVAGMGLIQLPDLMAAAEVGSGQLVKVLQRYAAPALPISIVYPSAQHLTPRLRALIDVLTRTHDRPLSRKPRRQ
ncbi:MAG: LysR family transcriptional regulator [Steroidobacteraceae bacterium]